MPGIFRQENPHILKWKIPLQKPVHKMYEPQKPHLGLLYQKCIENTMHISIVFATYNK